MEQIKKDPQLRLYCIALRHLSPIQKGIQLQHATVEYSRLKDNELYDQWADKDKTTILLEAHSSNNAKNSMHGLDPELGQMESIVNSLKENNIQHSVFHEPDINYALTAICIIVTDTVYDYTEFPDIELILDETIDEGTRQMWLDTLSDKWRNYTQNRFLRNLLKQFKLAS